MLNPRWRLKGKAGACAGPFRSILLLSCVDSLHEETKRIFPNICAIERYISCTLKWTTVKTVGLQRQLSSRCRAAQTIHALHWRRDLTRHKIQTLIDNSIHTLSSTFAVPQTLKLRQDSIDSIQSLWTLEQTNWESSSYRTTSVTSVGTNQYWSEFDWSS